MGFKQDLKFGEYYELELLKQINFDTYNKPQGNFKDYDIEIMNNDIKITYEVKADRMCYSTGNIAIEYECSNKLSGISTTKADNWAIFEILPQTYNLYIVPTIDLKKMINSKSYFKIVYGGDWNSSKMFLFNKTILNKYLQNNLI